MKTNKKGVGVVETFFAMTVFGMVGFVSLQGYSSDARNAKVISDINSITSAISIKTAEGGSIMAFTTEDNKNRLSDLSLAGKEATKLNYSVGKPNYTALGIRKDDFLNPQGGDYVIGVTTTGGNRLEIAGVIENNGKKEAILKGTYKGRNRDILKIDKIEKEDNVIILNSSATNQLKRGDYVRAGVLKYNVEKVNRDGVTVKLNRKIIGNPKTIFLVESEGKGLISDYRDNTKTVISGYNYALPY